jgi:hypothetical protein
MGVLDDAIREHLELKRRHGADPSEVAELEREAFGPGRRAPEPLEVPPAPVEPELTPELTPEPAAEPVDPLLIEPEVDAPVYEPPAEPAPPEPPPAVEPEPEPELAAEPEPPPPAPPAAEVEPAAEGEGEDVLEETPEFLQETPEHDRLWFEQRPPRDFDFDG